METSRQVQENNTTFTFWLLPRGIPASLWEKSARIAENQSLVVGRQSSAKQTVVCHPEAPSFGAEGPGGAARIARGFAGE